MNKDDAWAKSTSYHDQDGRNIIEFEIVEGPERGKKLYKGKINISVKAQVMTPMGPQVQEQKMPFEFDFPEGKTFNFCKKHFDDEANKAVKEWEAAQKKAQAEQRKRIVPANAGQVPKMLGPDGKPIG